MAGVGERVGRHQRHLPVVVGPEWEAPGVMQLQVLAERRARLVVVPVTVLPPAPMLVLAVVAALAVQAQDLLETPPVFPLSVAVAAVAAAGKQRVPFMLTVASAGGCHLGTS